MLTAASGRACLTSVGLSSVPTWCKPYEVLSVGERLGLAGEFSRLFLMPEIALVFFHFNFVPQLLGFCGLQAWTCQIQLSCQSISNPFAGTERIWPWHCSKEKLTQTSHWSSMNGPANWTETLQRWSPLHLASECETWLDMSQLRVLCIAMLQCSSSCSWQRLIEG